MCTQQHFLYLFTKNIYINKQKTKQTINQGGVRENDLYRRADRALLYITMFGGKHIVVS